MARQERAERTRVLLIEAASAEFVRAGYAGTTLSRVSGRADVTIGALTFHFSTKAALAETVCAWGADTTHRAVSHAARSVDSPWEGLEAVLRVLTELPGEDPVVRAAARLSREWEGARPRWRTSWAPTVRSLLDEVWRHGSLAPTADPRTVMELVELLVTGSGAAMVQDLVEHPETSSGGVRDRLFDIWRMVLPALTPAPGTGDR